METIKITSTHVSSRSRRAIQSAFIALYALVLYKYAISLYLFDKPNYWLSNIAIASAIQNH